MFAFLGIHKGDQFAVKQRRTQSVANGPSRGQHHHGVHRHGLVVDAQFLIDACPKQEQILLLHVKARHHASKPPLKGFMRQHKHPSSRAVDVIHLVHQPLHGLVGVVFHVEGVHHSAEKDPSHFGVWQFAQEFEQADDHNVLLMQLEALVDLGAGSKQLDAEFGQTLGHHVLPLSGHGLKHIDQLIKALQAVLQMHFGHLALHVSCRVTPSHGNALIAASSGKKGKQLDQCFKDACRHGKA